MTTTTTLVVGATGGTGKWVVKLLLDQGQKVKVIVRNKDRMVSLLKEMGQGENTETATDNLTITEAAILELSDDDLKEQVKGCNAVVSCLGHTMDYKGIWGQPRNLVTEACRRLTNAITASSSKAKFVLMGTEGVVNPNGQDDPRSRAEKSVLFLLRHVLPPHADNEAAADYLYNTIGSNSSTSEIEWTVIRPTDLIDDKDPLQKPTFKYSLYDKPQGSLFGSPTVATRSHVAHAMVELITNPDKWNEYKFKMPFIEDDTPPPDPATK